MEHVNVFIAARYPSLRGKDTVDCRDAIDRVRSRQYLSRADAINRVPTIHPQGRRAIPARNKRPVASGGPQVRVAVITWKGYSTLQMVYSFTPPGVETITMSPILWPSSALPTGDLLEISPAAGFASNAPTRV